MMVNIKQLFHDLIFVLKGQISLVSSTSVLLVRSPLAYYYSSINFGFAPMGINLWINKYQFFKQLNKSSDSLNKKAHSLKHYLRFDKEWLFYKYTNFENLNMDCVRELTTRELEILSLVSREFSSDEIANHLILSKHTIISHRKKMLIKMGAKNTAGMIRKGFELGYLSMSKPQ